MIAEVIVDVSSAEIDRIFDYNIPDNVNVQVGSRVVVPFGNRRIEGYVVGVKSESVLPKAKIKNIIALCDPYPAINNEMLELAAFMKEKYNLKMVDILRLFLPSSMRQGKVKPIIKQTAFVSENIDLKVVLQNIKKNATSQRALIEFFIKNNMAEKTYLNKMFGSSVVKKFVEMGVLELKDYEVKRTPHVDIEKNFNNNVTLTKAQQEVIKSIKVQQNQTILLHGVTGSGKTEVYMRCISHYLSLGKKAIMLVPEISLTSQVLKNFRARFGNEVALLHSGLSIGERYDEWRRIKEGQAKVVVGARSAIFAPIKDLGIIIIDEEHDTSYFSETNPRYYTHEVAKFRSKYNNCPLLLGSATPSVSSYKKAVDNEYKLLQLPVRVNNKDMPQVEVVDMSAELMNGNSSMFSTSLKHRLIKCMEEKNQAMIFINRRGFSSFLRCVECGHVPKCTECEVSLVYHKHDNQLKCHFCNKRYQMLTHCPECNSSKLRQDGIGTQRVVDELRQIFPEVKILRMDNDTTTNKNAHSKILTEFANAEPSILVGTQMIAKGHDFPGVTVVGIIDADLSLHFSDYRATERTFQLITQVAGRAGREEKEGHVILQTYSPRHYVYKFAANYNYKDFFNKEINLRRVTDFPPFTKIVRVLASGDDETKTQEFLLNFYNKVKQIKEKYKEDFIYLEAMKSPIIRIKNKFRYQILLRIKLKNYKDIIEEIYDIHNDLQGRSVISFVEVNPQNLS